MSVQTAEIDDETAPIVTAEDTAAPELTEDLLVEEVSIDGMCGVY